MSAAAPAADTPLFSARTILVMALAGVFAFAAFMVLIAYAPDLRNRRDGGAHALSKSATGYAALVDLGRLRGLEISIHGDRGDMPPGARVRVLTPDPAAGSRGIAGALKPGPDEVVVVILPKWATMPDPTHRGWVRRAGSNPTAALEALFEKNGRPNLQEDKGPARVTLVPNPIPGFEIQAPPADAGWIRGLRTLSGDGFDPLLRDGRGRTLIGRAARDGLVVVADADLFNTQGLSNRERARMAVAVLGQLAGERPVVFDVSANGFGGSRNVLKLAFEPPFLAATLCAAAAAALIGWHAAARFGAPKSAGRAIALGKTALADNSAALLHLARREHRMAEPYAALTMQAAARAVGVPKGMAQEDAAAMLDRLSLKAGAEESASRLTDEARAVTDTAGLMRIARKLRAFRRRMTREA